MENNFSCFTNTACPYYPCHKTHSAKDTETKQTEDFNCLFCYCPLYALPHCPGSPEYILNNRGQEIKDCSHCLFPHKPENYEKVLSHFMDIQEIISLPIKEIYGKMEQLLKKRSGFDHMDRESLEEHETVALYIYEMFLQNSSLNILLQPFSGKCVKETGFVFPSGITIPCHILEKLQLTEKDIVSGYFYTFHAPEISTDPDKLSLLEQCYLESWLIASIDAGRDWIQSYLFRKHNVRESKYVTDSFGPGYYGMPIEALSDIFQIFSGEPVGVSLLDNGNMTPLKSSIGMYLVLNKDVSHLMGHDCTSCAGSKLGCNACRK